MRISQHCTVYIVLLASTLEQAGGILETPERYYLDGRICPVFPQTRTLWPDLMWSGLIWSGLIWSGLMDAKLQGALRRTLDQAEGRNPGLLVVVSHDGAQRLICLNRIFEDDSNKPPSTAA